MLSQRLKELRKVKKVTQQDVANHLGITRPAYTAYENGNRNPDYDLLDKLALYFDVTTDYLLGREIKQTDNPELADFERWINDPKSNIFFKEFIESPEDRREALLQMWEILKKQEKA